VQTRRSPALFQQYMGSNVVSPLGLKKSAEFVEIQLIGFGWSD
jgi:hypothetical protein